MATFELVDLRDSSGIQFHNVIDVDGQRVNTFGYPPGEVAEIIHNLVNLPIRDDDVMVCTAVRSGTHWAYEVISMLLKGKAENTPIPKVASMLEMHPREELEELPSPRVLNSHLPLYVLPRQIKEKKTKIVLVLRNPKDVLVSFFHHQSGLTNHLYDGTIADYFEVFMEGRLEYGSWFDYVRGMEKEIDKGDYAIHVVYYEDMKENGFEEITKLASFLDVPKNEDLFKTVYEKCQFVKMAKAKEYPEEVREIFFRHGYNVFRKGQIGDWKNYFTEAMNEKFDQVYNEKIKGSKLNFRFEAS